MATMTSVEMLAFVNGGGSIIYRGRTISTAEAVPSQNQLDADAAADLEPVYARASGFARITVSETEPTSPVEGDLWIQIT